MPATPWMPSMMTAAKRPVASSSSTRCRSPSGANSTWSVALKGARSAALSVAATAPDVRPWKASVKARMCERPVWNEASFMAFSLASAPELQRKSA